MPSSVALETTPAPAKVSKAAAAARTAWIDMARGMAEVSVVTFHILQAMNNAGLTPVGLFDFWTPVGDMIRMPLMMFVAGLFVEYSLRKGTKAYFVGKTQRVIWPYVIWAHVYSIYWYAKPSSFDHRSLEQVFFTIINPGSHLWFLESLFIYYVAAYFLLKRGYWTMLAVAAASLLIIPFFEMEEIRRLPYLFLFFVFGIGFNRILRQRGFPFGPYIGIALIALAIALPILITNQFGYSKYFLIAIPASIVGVAACLQISRFLVHVPGINKLLMLFGTFSLEIYCAHVVFSSFTRQVLVGVFHWQSFWPIFLLCTTAGLFLPIVLALGLRRIGLDVLFEWPKHLFQREPAVEAQNF
ncbi:MAG TPA: acyltransferase [Candidatus Binatia bacterium]|nr:acyltransferase [Candidatus Binatia bacterium]